MNFWDFANEHAFAATLMVFAAASCVVQPFVSVTKVIRKKRANDS